MAFAPRNKKKRKEMKGKGGVGGFNTHVEK